MKYFASLTNNVYTIIKLDNEIFCESDKYTLLPQVTNLHTDMVQWMVHMLLRLAPNRKDASREAREALLLNTQTLGQLQQTGVSLFEQLQKFTKYVTG